jgi:type I restriction enzyme R subunit
MKTPEQQAREKIDQQLRQAGWIIQTMKSVNPAAGLGVAICEYPTDTGPVDYLLMVNKKPVGVIEAKRAKEGERITTVEDQAERYATSQLKWSINQDPLPFVYESTGILTHFRDLRDPKPRSRRVFSFHRPETMQKCLEQEHSLRARLHHFPKLNINGLRDCQINAIQNLEQSFKENRPRALIQMATGSGKTFTAITSVYRLLKFAGAKRILFLVDTKNLGEQAEQEFMAYSPNDDPRKFTELYVAQRLTSSSIPDNLHVCISTIQRMYSILKGEELDESTEETNPNEMKLKKKEPLPVVYNPKIPPEFFDFIIIDECHRSIYNLWKQVLEYFDAFLIGLTATPDNRTFGFFNENVVSEYSHEKAVADGVNVGYEIYTIETKITKEGAKIEAQEFVDKRNRLTRRKRWEQLDEEVHYSKKQLDKEVVNPSTIRNIIKAFKSKLQTEIFPGRDEVPKTLIFAKSDSHADDIIKIVREEFGEGNQFCKKVTYKSEDDPKNVLQSFRNDFYPRVAVTVDMIATGTDVKPIECLLFMRDVKSKNYYEQMKGRGTRTLGQDDLQKVTPSAPTAKTHFVIIDAVGVCKSVKTDSRPLERKKSVSLKDLMMTVAMGLKDEDTLTSLAGRLARLNQEIDRKEKEKMAELANGRSISSITKDLLNAFDPDVIHNQAREHFQLPEETPPSELQLKEAQERLIEKAAQPFYQPEFREYVENVRKTYDQIIDTVNRDEITHAGWDQDAEDKAKAMVQSFREYIEANKEEIAALRIFYNQPYQQRSFTYQMIKELNEKLKADKPQLAPLRVWQAYEQLEKVNSRSPKNELIALVSLIRRVSGIDDTLTPYDKTVNKNFQDWVFKKQAGPLKFTPEQMDWLRMIKDHIATSFRLEREDLDYTPFDAEGGVGKMYQLFGSDMDEIIDELNKELVA